MSQNKKRDPVATESFYDDSHVHCILTTPMTGLYVTEKYTIQYTGLLHNIGDGGESQKRKRHCQCR